ncbi:hypothetical protein BCR43DRAFT_489305 [Syncephalastrum racemosum]|uniref:Uncharacterized protein n=1 Tax=Syncephalastrum racemosum TaxID=13706 RepID=A0A1X2HK69_SYNRA|nr:hypothetical protein BCR43DRAFT_489298 [Syncephalastrum racemosum]ORY99451.1 hypothetical protein BCR43DRAFT_489301 [Syncephalastrum racemosum]ORY99454.1 hypothetical protein BCR43DRAFT_489305 [Syncephalastrum racemosum]
MVFRLLVHISSVEVMAERHSTLQGVYRGVESLKTRSPASFQPRKYSDEIPA